jgi:hypothetical protein
MPDITLHIPENSRFSSSMNEIDMCMKEIFLTEMRIADPRDKSHKQISQGANFNWLWEPDRVFQVDEMTTEDIFETWLLRHSQVNKNVDVTYPLLAYKQNDIKTVFWGTGNRYHQHYIMVTPNNADPEVGDTVAIVDRSDPKLFGVRCKIDEIIDGNRYILTYITTGDKVKGNDGKTRVFQLDELRQLGAKSPVEYKAKGITGTYSAVVLVDNRDEAQYIRDHFILRCNDANIWFKYASPTLGGVENQIYTVFEIPTLERYPSATDRLKGQGYIYGVGFEVNVWAALTDTPLPANIIEMIRLSIKEDAEERYRRYIITQ